jgi:16S rRNA (guanine527-N7)-methyltransferase
LSGLSGPPNIPDAARAPLERYLARLAADPRAPTSVSDPQRAWKVHVLDSLTGLQVSDVAAARAIADVGSGGGFPGVGLAASLPQARVDLIESVSRRCDFIRAALIESGIANARVVCLRSEEWGEGEGRQAYEVVTSRAVGRLSTLAELASPLLREGGLLVAWKGRRNEEEELELARAAGALAMRPEEVHAVGPYAGSRHRHLHTIRKCGPTPANLPRRPGMAKKRPLGADGGAD